MGISAIYGLPGRGKSLFSTYLALTLSEKYQKKIVTNFPLKPLELAHYCRYLGLSWVSQNLNKDLIYYIPIELENKTSICNLLKLKHCIIVIDECGVYLPARGSTYNTPQKLLDALCQVRHQGQYLIYISQSDKQVDSALRNLCEEVFVANGQVRYSSVLRNDELTWKQVFRFLPDGFSVYQSDAKLRSNPFKCWILSNFKAWFGPLSSADLFSFSIYDSFSKLSDQKINDSGNPLSYTKVSVNFPAWKISGYNPSSSHHFSWLISILMKFLPYPFLKIILRLDVRLSKFQGLNPLERSILKFGIPVVILLVLGSFL